MSKIKTKAKNKKIIKINDNFKGYREKVIIDNTSM